MLSLPPRLAVLLAVGCDCYGSKPEELDGGPGADAAPGLCGEVVAPTRLERTEAGSDSSVSGPLVGIDEDGAATVLWGEGGGGGAEGGPRRSGVGRPPPNSLRGSRLQPIFGWRRHTGTRRSWPLRVVAS